MSAFNLLHPDHRMIGIDLHDAIVPPSGRKIPSLPHTVFAPLHGASAGYAATVLHVPNVRVCFAAALQRSTDIGSMIKHVQINALVPFIMYDSKSKSEFGAGTVRVGGRPVGVAVFQTFNLNLNCGDPTRLPSGYVNAPSTVRAGMTLGDLYAGLAEMAFDIAWAMLKSKVFKAAIMPAISRILGKSFAALLKGNPQLAAIIEKAIEGRLRQGCRQMQTGGPLGF